MKFDLRPVVAASALALGATQAFAATPIGDYLTFSGFGTLGLVQTDTNDAQFVRDRQPAGATKTASFDVDSNLGLQLTAQPMRWISGTVQLLAQQRSDINLSPEVEWAFVKVEPLKGLSIRGGRMALPLFAISDTRNVGYANTWVRPPDEVYGLALLHRMQGGDISYRLPIASTSLTVSALVGKSFFFGPGGDQVSVDNLKGMNAQWESDWVTLRYGRVTGDVQLAGLVDHYTFSGFGAIVDRNNIVAQAEYVTRRSKAVPDVVNVNGWYVLGGYRINAVLPYVTYGHTKPVNPDSPFHLSNEQSTIAAGVRWDAFRSADLKLQVERVDTNGTTGVSFVTQGVAGPPGAPASSLPVTTPVTAFSLAVDFVF